MGREGGRGWYDWAWRRLGSCVEFGVLIGCLVGETFRKHLFLAHVNGSCTSIRFIPHL